MVITGHPASDYSRFLTQAFAFANALELEERTQRTDGAADISY